MTLKNFKYMTLKNRECYHSLLTNKIILFIKKKNMAATELPCY